LPSAAATGSRKSSADDVSSSVRPIKNSIDK
jgi:hypothetical protein